VELGELPEFIGACDIYVTPCSFTIRGQWHMRYAGFIVFCRNTAEPRWRAEDSER
jgi:hypothetical protein